MPSSNSTSPPERRCLSRTVTTPTRRPSVGIGIDGVPTFTLEERTIEVGPGDALCIPRGAVHRFDNLHAANSRTLAIVSPGILGPDYFREIAAIAKAAAASVPPAPPDPRALAEVMRRHGLTPALSGLD